MHRRRLYLAALVAVALLTAGVVWFVMPPGGDSGRSSPVVVEVGGHMHTMGSSFSLTLNPGTDGEQAIFEIPQWDFNWQGRYQYETPVRLAQGDVVRISCTWNKGTGEGRRYTVWGE